MLLSLQLQYLIYFDYLKDSSTAHPKQLPSLHLICVQQLYPCASLTPKVTFFQAGDDKHISRGALKGKTP